MAYFVRNTWLKEQRRGPILNIIVSVTGKETETVQDDAKTHTFTVDAKVKVFFKPIFRGSDLILYVNIQKIESVQNCNVEITCRESRKVITCSEESIEVQLNTIKPMGCQMFTDMFYDSECRQRTYTSWMQFIIEVNITVHEIPMSKHTQLYEDTEFTDFQLKAADGSVAVHKSILAFQSDVFKTMLKGEWKETVEGCINIDGVTIETLQHLKDYMYLGTLPDEGLEPLILLAEHYLMDKLKSECITKLVKSVKPENFGRIIKLACQSGIAEELMLALISGIPSDVVNNIHEFKKKKTESNDEN